MADTSGLRASTGSSPSRTAGAPLLLSNETLPGGDTGFHFLTTYVMLWVAGGIAVAAAVFALVFLRAMRAKVSL